MESVRVRDFHTSSAVSEIENEWAQRTSEISDTSPASVKILYKALSML